MKKNYFKDLFKTFSISIFLYTNALSIACLFLFRHLFDSVPFNGWVCIVSIITVFVAAILFIVFKPIKAFKSYSVGYFDVFLFSFATAILIISILCLPQFEIIAKNGGYLSFILSVSIFGLLSVLIICRFIRFALFKKDERDIRLMSFRDFTDISKLPTDKKRCLIREEAVDYDLLDRQYIINRLESAIKALSCEGGNIAITGKWGAGKTTLLNVVLHDKKNDFIICDDVNPWDYDNPKMLFVSIVNSIYRHLGIGGNSKAILEHLKKYASTFLKNDEAASLFDILDFDSPNNDDTIQMIDSYLVRNNKNVIVILDNLDRATNDIILFTYKVVSSILKIHNVIFVCLFDEVRAEGALNEYGLHYDFLEKVFSVVIKVPNPSKSSLYRTIYPCLDSYFSKYFGKAYNKFDETDKKIVRTIIGLCDNLRTFALLFNSISNILSQNESSVHLTDLLAIEYLKIKHDGSFELIKNNPDCFICCHKLQTDTYHYRSSEENIERRRKLVEDYFKDGKEYYKYYDLLELVFPNFVDYGANELTGEERNRAEEGKRIYSGKYFSTYFNEKETDYSLLNENLSQALSISDINIFYKTLDKLFDSYSITEHNGVLKQILSMISNEGIKLNNLLWYMLSRYHWFDGWIWFLSLTSRQVCVEIIAKILDAMSEKEFKDFLESYKHQADYNVVLLNDIYKSLSAKLKHEHSNELVKKINGIKELIEKTVNDIKSTIIGPFADSFYDLGMSYVLRSFDEDWFKNYIGNNLKNRAVLFGFLNDCVAVSYHSDSKVYYSLSLQAIEQVVSVEKIRIALNSVNLFGANERIIEKLFTLLMEHKDDEDEASKSLSYDADNQPTFNYDFYNRSKQSRIFLKP